MLGFVKIYFRRDQCHDKADKNLIHLRHPKTVGMVANLPEYKCIVDI